MKFLKGEVGILSDEARKLGITEVRLHFFFCWRNRKRKHRSLFLQVIIFGVSTK